MPRPGSRVVAVGVHRRRWRWWSLLLTGVVFAAAGCVWLVALSLNDSGQSRVAGSFLALGGLLTGVAQVLLGIVQLRRDTPPVAAPLAPGGGRPGVHSLDPPLGLLEEQVRGRAVLITELVGLDRWWARRGPRRVVRVRVLHGMGGSGKTTVALAVAQQLRQRGVRVWWVSAATAADLQTGMRELAAQVGATDAEIDRAWSGLGSATDLLWRGLAAYSGRWLLVIDNADDPHILAPADEVVAAGRGWVRPVLSRSGAILVTSRDRRASVWTATDPVRGREWCRLQPVDVLPAADGARVLLDHAGPGAGTVEQAAALAGRLGGLPLALGLAGRYLADANQLPLPGAITTFTAYQRALTTDGVTAVFDHPAEALRDARARRVIDRTWELSLDLLAQRGLAQARALLRLLAVLADSPIPCQLLDPAVMAVSPLFADLNPPRLRGLLQALAGLGLVDLNRAHTAPENNAHQHPVAATLRLHPLIRDTSRHHLDQSGQTATTVALAAALLYHAVTSAPDPPEQPTSWPAWQLLTPHALYLVSAVTATNRDPTVMSHAAAAARQATDYLGAIGLYATAQSQSQVMLHACQQVLGPEHPDTLAAQHNLAGWTGRAGDPAAARDQLAALLPLRHRACGPEHPDTLLARVRLAHWTGEAGDPAAARDQLAALLPQLERLTGPEHPHTLQLRRHLADWTGEAGDRGAALPPVRDQFSGPGHPDTLLARHNLAAPEWMGRAGDPAAARDQYAALLPRWERVYGPEHPDTLAVRNNLADWTGRAGDPAAARDHFAALVPLRERISGPEHPDTLLARHNLAGWTGEAGDPAAARDQLAALVPLRERISGPEHPYTLAMRSNLAGSTGRAGDPAAARDQYAALLPVRERASGPEHPHTLLARSDLAFWTGEAGDPAAARDQLAALLPRWEQVHGPEHPSTLLVRDNLAGWTRQAERHQKR